MYAKHRPCFSVIQKNMGNSFWALILQYELSMKTKLWTFFILYCVSCIYSNSFAQSLDGDITKLQFLNNTEYRKNLNEMESLLLKLNPQHAVGGNVSGGGGNVSGGSNSRLIYKGSSEDIHLIQSYQISQLGLLNLHQNGFDGKTYRAVIVDSGVNPESNVARKVFLFKDFTSECAESMCDLSGHGTLVADLVVQSAPSASLVVLKVLSENTKGDFNHVVKALKWILANHKKMNIKVVNLSLVSPDRVYGYYNEVDEAREIVKKLYENGVLIISAVGNDYKKKNIDLFPASSIEVISVGSYSHNFSNDRSVRELSPFSNFGIANQPVVQHSSFLWFSSTQKDFRRWSFKPEILAPGEKILACNNSCEFVSGTSFSSALVTGGLLSLLDKEPDMTRDQIMQFQKNKCKNPLLSYDGGYLWGRFEVCALELD